MPFKKTVQRSAIVSMLVRRSMQLTLLLATVSILMAADRPSEWITILPAKTDAILANPGVGWQTFHRTAKIDKSLPDWIPSTVCYQRFSWRELEPARGKIDEVLLRRFLQQTKAAGQKGALRVMCCSSTPGEPYHPTWLVEAGGKVVATRYGWSRKLEVPDLDDRTTLAAHLDFIKRLGAILDGDKDLDHVDIGSVGWWGEWHMSDASNASMPTPKNQKRIVDAYLTAFSNTPLLMLVNGGEMLAYATSKGAGWRADSLGDMGTFWKKWSHMRVAYPQWLTDAKVLDVWRQAPVAFETGGDMRVWAVARFDFRYIFDYALALHASQINNKSASLPKSQKTRQEIRRFLRRLGYRFELIELRHPKQMAPGKMLTLHMRWRNTGSAPCYRRYHLAYRLTDRGGKSRVISSAITVERWMPGSVKPFTPAFMKSPPVLPPGKIVDVVDSVPISKNLAPGRYRLALAVVEEDANTPIVQLGIAGRDPSGWYPLSSVECKSSD